MVYIKVEYHAFSKIYLFTLPQEHRLALSQVNFSWLALLFDHGLTVIFWSQFQIFRVHSLCCVDQDFETKLKEMRLVVLVKCGYSTNLIDLSNWWRLMTPSEVTSAIKLNAASINQKIFYINVEYHTYVRIYLFTLPQKHAWEKTCTRKSGEHATTCAAV